MASLFDSRVSSPGKESRGSVSHTRTSSAFRTTSRTTKAHWGNRFVRDFNDLAYDIKYDLIKGKNQLNQQRGAKRNLKNDSKMSSRRSVDINSSRKRSGSAVDRTQNIFRLIKMNKTVNPEQYKLHEEKKYSTLDSQGLCKHEFQKTITGKMAHKSNHHMCFGYQTERSKNVNRVWYDPKEELNFNKMINTIKRNKVNQCHDFGSYTNRKVFEPREELDKFYDTKGSQKIAVARRIKETMPVQKATPRKDPKLPPGTQLSYNEYDSRKKTMNRPPSYEISKNKRQLVFKPQVISPQRGCYR